MTAMNTTIDTEHDKVSRFHWRMVVTAGTGFFTDAYDLFVIGVVTSLLAPIWHLSTLQVALLNGAALASAAFGAIIFGTLSDKLGRKKMYGFEILILFCGALFASFANGFIWLFIARIIVGFGIGGDYPSSAVVASEHSPAGRRGFLVLLVFAMQALGLIFGPLFASLLIASNLPHDIVWRVLIGFGALPAACVFFMRRRIAESPHYLRSKKAPVDEVSRVVHDLTEDEEKPEEPSYEKQRLLSKKWLTYLVGTASAWFLLDVAFYGNGISSLMIIKSISPHLDLLHHMLISTLIFFVFAVPGYALAAKYIDKIGRKPLQYLGFLVIAICYALIAFVAPVMQILPLFIVVFGVSFFFVNFGPNTTTFLIPSEIYPTTIRAKAHGISAAVGKVGAFAGAFIVPLFLHHYGMRFTMGVMSVIALLGIAATTLLPEMKSKDLSSVED